MPHGVPKLDTLPYPFKIITMPGEVAILHEMFYQYRQVFTDGREIPKEKRAHQIGSIRPSPTDLARKLC